MRHINLRVPDEMYDEIQRIAKLECRSMNNELIWMIQSYAGVKLAEPTRDQDR